MRNRMIRVLLAGAGLAVVGGCAVGPNYVEPVIDSPANWSGESAAAAASSVGDLRAWWSQLGDARLDALVDRALAGNLDLKEAEARVRETRALRGIAASALLPTLDTSAGYSRREDSPNTGSNVGGFARGGDGYDQYTAGFDAGWELDFFGRVQRSVEASDADIQAAQYARHDVMVILTSEVARNYIELLTTQRRLQITRANEKLQQETLDLTKSRFDAGLTSELDVARAQANLQTTRAQVPSLENQIQRSIHRLGVLIGKHPGTLIGELKEMAGLPVAPKMIAAGLPSELLRRRPDLRNAERQLAAQTARIGVATADLYPKITLAGNVGWSANKFATLFDASSVGYGIGPSVSWNIFDYHRIRSNITAQGAKAEQLVTRYERAVLNAFGEVEDAISGFNFEQQRSTSLSLAADATRRSVDLAQELYKNGLTDFNAVLDAQRQLLLIQDQEIQSQGLVVTSSVALFKALGGGWSEAGPQSDAPAGGPVRAKSVESK